MRLCTCEGWSFTPPPHQHTRRLAHAWISCTGMSGCFPEFVFLWNMHTQPYLSFASTCTHTSELISVHRGAAFRRQRGGRQLMSHLIIPPDRHEILSSTKESLSGSFALEHFCSSTFSNCALIRPFFVFDSAPRCLCFYARQFRLFGISFGNSYL